jgi:hypothetical protein
VSTSLKFETFRLNNLEDLMLPNITFMCNRNIDALEDHVLFSYIYDW